MNVETNRQPKFKILPSSNELFVISYKIFLIYYGQQNYLFKMIQDRLRDSLRPMNWS